MLLSWYRAVYSSGKIDFALEFRILEFRDDLLEISSDRNTPVDGVWSNYYAGECCLGMDGSGHVFGDFHYRLNSRGYRNMVKGKPIG
jgi:hypothetical protein